MTLFQSIALALGFIAVTWLLVLLGKGLRWLGRKRRARWNATIDRRVEEELSPDEQLFWVDSVRAQPFIGAILAVFGFILFAFFAGVCVWGLCEPPKEGAQTGLAMVILTPFIGFGLLAFYCGIYAMFLQKRRYCFVTSKRLAFRGISFTGKRV